MKEINNFVRRFAAKVNLDKNLVVKKQKRYFLLNENLKQHVQRDFFYAGTYLGKVKKGIFFPSFNLLAMIAERKANKMVVDGKTEWLFVCGRDVFKRGIRQVIGSKRKGDYTLILNQHGECLGFGKILCNIDEEKSNEVVVKNISDIGDFLRREK